MEKEGKEIKENTNDKKEVLKFENVSLTYHTKDGETLALKDINFSVYEKEFVAIVGPSGWGKTTIAYSGNFTAKHWTHILRWKRYQREKEKQRC